MSEPANSEVFECVHAERCGGCAFMSPPGQPLATQLARKQRAVQSALAPYLALCGMQIAAVAAAEPALGYRVRAKLVVSAAGEIGLYERGSHTVLDIPGCRVLHPALLALVAALREQLAHEPCQGLHALDLRVVHAPDSPAQVLATLIGMRPARTALATLGHWLGARPGVCGVALRLQDEPAVQLLEGELEPLVGESVARDCLQPNGPYHYATFGSFVQAHRGQAAAMARAIAGELTQRLGSLRGRRVLELFAGSGALALELSQLGADVTLVERYAPALAHAVRAQREQALSALHTHAGDAELVLRELMQRGPGFDALIVNPPRRGLTPGLRALLAQLPARALVYVSCDPETLARDLSHLASCGWTAAGLRPFDMIPLSDGVESLVVLQPTAPFPLSVLHEDAQLLVVDKPAHLPTTPDAAHAGSLLERLQRERGLPELCAVHRLDVGTSGVCLFAKAPRYVHALAERLAAGDKRYEALVRGVVRPKGIVRAALREQGKTRPAVSRYTRHALLGTHSLVRVRPEQGRTHQVRKHMAAIGHPVLGDARHGDAASNRYFEHRYGLDRCFLHAARIVLPARGEQPELILTAPLAPDLAALLARLRS